MYMCIMNQKGEILYHKNIPTDRLIFLSEIEPYREDIVVAVECVFTWYWLADLCMKEHIDFVLGHALYMKAIDGGKTKNDKIDSQKIAALLRGGMIPQAYVYPPKMRAARDLLRRRIFLSRKRAEFLSHIQNTNYQYNLEPIGKRISYKANRVCLDDHFKNPLVQINIDTDLKIISSLEQQIKNLESVIIKCARHHDKTAYSLLRTIPGVGKILGLTILYEIQNIERFPRVQNFVSYSRLIKCPRESSGKRMGSKNSKIGNANLKWAFSEAACLFIRDNDMSKEYHKKLFNKYGHGKALSIIAHKLARATYYILKRRTPFDYDLFYSALLSGVHERDI
jgi:transposase